MKTLTLDIVKDLLKKKYDFDNLYVVNSLELKKDFRLLDYWVTQKIISDFLMELWNSGFISVNSDNGKYRNYQIEYCLIDDSYNNVGQLINLPNPKNIDSHIIDGYDKPKAQHLLNVDLKHKIRDVKHTEYICEKIIDEFVDMTITQKELRGFIWPFLGSDLIDSTIVNSTYFQRFEVMLLSEYGVEVGRKGNQNYWKFK